jgi:predicted RNase H-like HicB family nuclease
VSKTTGYIALVHKDKDTSYGVSFPDVPGCISAGDTFEQAIDNAAVALVGHLAVMEADGDPIPKARSLEELKRDAEFVEDSVDAVVALVAPGRSGDNAAIGVVAWVILSSGRSRSANRSRTTACRRLFERKRPMAKPDAN